MRVATLWAGFRMSTGSGSVEDLRSPRLPSLHRGSSGRALGPVDRGRFVLADLADAPNRAGRLATTPAVTGPGKPGAHIGGRCDVPRPL